MKAALITDTHFGARSDSIPFDNFFRKFYEECFWPKIDEEGIETIFHLGDCFDRRKYINFNTLTTCREYFFDQAKKRNIKLVMIAGNHDTFFKNTNKVNSPGLLLRDYSNVVCYTAPMEYSIGGTSILLMPWICSENYEESLNALKIASSKHVFGHFEIAGFQMYKGHVNDHGMESNIFSRFDSVFSGHFHHRSTQGNITYLGNPYELTWSDFEDPRGFHIWDSNTKELEFVANPFTMFVKHYYNDSQFDPRGIDTSFAENKHVKLIVIEKKDFKKFDEFVDRLYKRNPVELKIIEDLSEFENDALDDSDVNVEDTMSLLSKYVDSLDTDADKDRLKNIMRELYVEAQDFEGT
ncbi:recombinase [bacterium]|nr:recombinase [bacterium]